MADLSQIKTPDGTVYDLVSKTGRGLVNATMNDSASTATKFVFSAPNVTSLYDGLTIIAKNTKVDSKANCQLNLNSLGDKAIWRSLDNTDIGTLWKKNAIYILTFDYTNDRWYMHLGYNSNTNTYVTQSIATGDANRPLMMSYYQVGSSTTSAQVEYRNDSMYANPSTGTITATNFNGKINNHTVEADVPSNAVFTDTNNRRSYFGTCSTAAATAAKEVTLANSDGWELVAGVVIGVKFSNTNSASNVTLNVNGTGAKSIYFSNAVYTGNSTQITGYANLITYYMYDGTNWAFLNAGDNYRDTDTKVYQTLNSNNEKHPILLSYAQSSNTTTTVNNLSYRNNDIYANPSTGTITATDFEGKFNGHSYLWSRVSTGQIGSTLAAWSWSSSSGEVFVSNTSTIIPFCENASKTPIPFTSISVSNNMVLLFFPELTEATSFKILVIN